MGRQLPGPTGSPYHGAHDRSFAPVRGESAPSTWASSKRSSATSSRSRSFH